MPTFALIPREGCPKSSELTFQAKDVHRSGEAAKVDLKVVTTAVVTTNALIL